MDESEAEPPEASPGKRKAGKQVHPDKPTKCRKMDACIASAAEFWKKFEPYRLVGQRSLLGSKAVWREKLLYSIFLIQQNLCNQKYHKQATA